ncbi:MAG: hypothetical protein UU65_C0006G0014 [candidate division CPR2 bacterium GW2011_GWC1_41_48]|uniref:MtN3 and saliva related transmembrane protein n=1 Tax=candidate division CPR2 bacterium GW2011_GWC1_41_48 TaxID=1618344 RepID=A0A0G0W6Q4_UNCC2|nr:MAG: hypothetical protein UT47_C0006G0004 [candidate division CPR2 bacterium GW2011_GWC2_39_35]KKR27320.1 MAG: hypothetical protein UT59_C0061G0007 [candidate division CPR2 bacterium GW2011_GWD1_39_7]KKR27649.1 MAG: hypothetical protein UT60_C0042G0003 [candidate division CPR2 bacterium GW2011_GWD2_39_7]KKS08644.1 MAG: hypothetical protein UU65_C0006G0014 [candidate division CPR2 bacterium GW2011_GWC1_41_48]OGB58060.1 MAG: hypothetical protein A2Y27_02455 [candidate division CPR2 bacterium G
MIDSLISWLLQNISIILIIISTPIELMPFLQMKKSIKNKSVNDLSPYPAAGFSLLGIMWLSYGMGINSLPLVVTNVAKLISNISVVCVYFYFRSIKK